MKCRIFIDTNPIWEDKGPFSTLFNSSFSDLSEFLSKHSVKNTSICLPKIVIRERIQHKKELMDSAIGYINERIKSLQEAGHTETEIESKLDYIEKLQEFAEDFCKKNKIEIIPQPSVSVEELTDLVVNKKKPFNDHGSGFKDTLIYLSMVQDVEKNKGDTYILCTNNHKQFDQEIIDDFKIRTGKELIIIPDLVSVQQKLDEIIPIGLHLEKRNIEVKNFVESKLGDLMKEINTTQFSVNNSRLWRTSPQDRFFWNPTDLSATDMDSSEIVGYNFYDINFSSIEEIAKDNIQVQLSLVTEIVYKDNKIDDDLSIFSRQVSLRTSPFLRSSPGMIGYQPSKKEFNFLLDCDLNAKIILIRRMNQGFAY